jgi:hypothetical protein
VLVTSPSNFPPHCRNRAAVAAAAILQIVETATARELPAALVGYLDDAFLDAQREALADYAHLWGAGDA